MELKQFHKLHTVRFKSNLNKTNLSDHLEDTPMDINIAAAPGYGAKLKMPEFYALLNSTINVLRGRVSLAVIAQHLANQKLETPSGKDWTKDRLASYLKSNAYKGI
jgi:hypothetical protein